MGGLRTTLRLVLLGGPIFYLFHVCTRWFYYLLTVDMGGAQYRASGRGFIIGDHATTVKTPSHIHLSVPCWCCRARDLPQHVSAVRSITLCSWHGALVRARGPVHPRSHWVRASAPSATALAAAAVSQLTSRCGSVFIAANWPAWMFAITCLWAPFLYNFEGACHSALALRCFF